MCLPDGSFEYWNPFNPNLGVCMCGVFLLFIFMTMTSCWRIVTLSSFFKFMVDLAQSETRIPDAWSKILTFLLIAK